MRGVDIDKEQVVQKLKRGMGLLELMIILIVVSLVGFKAFQEFGHQLHVVSGQLAGQISGHNDEICTVSTSIQESQSREYVFDARVNRYRNRRTGRFMRQEHTTLTSCK